MSKIFKNLKSIFIVEDPDASAGKTNRPKNAKETAENIPSSPVNESATKSIVTESFATESVEGEVLQNFIDILFAAIEKKNQSGFDYLEYKQSLRHMAEIQMEESVRFQSAFAAAKPQGIDKQKLLDSAQHYLEVLFQEDEKFQAVLAKQKARHIENGEMELQTLNQSIEDKQRQIEKLTAEIAAEEQKLVTAEETLKASAQKVVATKKNFEASLAFLKDQIESDIDKIKQYIS